MDSATDPGLHEVMDELLESVYGEEILSQQSQLSVVAPVSDEDDDCDSDNEAFSCDPDPTRLAREFVESNNWEGEIIPRERKKKKKEFPSGAAAQNNVFLCSKIRDS